MKKHKWSTRFAGVLLAVSMLLNGCGGASADESQQADTEETISIVFCHNQPVGSPEDVGAQAMVEKLKDKLEIGTLFTFTSLLVYFLEPIKNIINFKIKRNEKF